MPYEEDKLQGIGLRENFNYDRGNGLSFEIEKKYDSGWTSIYSSSDEYSVREMLDVMQTSSPLSQFRLIKCTRTSEIIMGSLT